MKEESTTVTVSQGGFSETETKPEIGQLGSSLWSWVAEL